MQEEVQWYRWFLLLCRGHLVPLDTLSGRVRIQLIVAAATIAALLDVVTAWLGWVNPTLREQYIALNAAVARRWGYTPPTEPSFSALGVFAASLFGNSVGAAVVWGIAGVAIRLVFRQPIAFGIIIPSAMLPLPIASAINLLTTLFHLTTGAIQLAPSLGMFLDPLSSDIRLFAIASKLDLGAFAYAFAMVRLLLPHQSWHATVLGGVVGFLLRSAIIAGGILLAARVAL